jgi:hypothetical protein
MRIYRVTREEILKAAEGIATAEVDYQNPSRGGGYTFRVKLYPLPGDDSYRRVSVSPWQNERRVNAICWHGFEDFFKALFDLNPNARAVTAMATYDGKEGFYETYPETAWRNVGSQMFPVCACDSCICDRRGEGAW